MARAGQNLTEADTNVDLITELEFTEALSGLSKDMAPGPDKVKYSDIKNLSVDNKSKLFPLYEECSATGQVPTWENAARSAYDVYQGFQRKEQTLAVAVGLEDAYNRVQFKLLVELLVQYDVSLTLTR